MASTKTIFVVLFFSIQRQFVIVFLEKWLENQLFILDFPKAIRLLAYNFYASLIVDSSPS